MTSFKRFPWLSFVLILGIILSLLLFHASAVEPDGLTVSTVSSSAEAAEPEPEEEEKPVYYDDTELRQQIQEISDMMKVQSESTTDSEILSAATQINGKLDQILQVLQSAPSSTDSVTPAEPAEGELDGLQYEQYMLGIMIFFVVVIVCYFTYKFFNMFF